MKPIEQLILNKIGEGEDKSKETRNKVRPGSYAFDFLLHIKGNTDVGEDFETTPTVSIPIIETLALFVSRAGFTRKKSLELLSNCVKDAILGNKKGAKGEIERVLPELTETIKKIKKEVLAELPKAKRKGIVKIECDVNKVETKEIAIEALDNIVAQR